MKGLLIGMVAFDLFLHIWELIKGTHFVIWLHYNPFWVAYWGIFLVLLVYELYLKRNKYVLMCFIHKQKV